MFISVNAQKILKILHIITTSCWMGGCLALTILMHVSQYAESDAELFGMLKSYKYINVLITVYLGAYGSLFTGLAYSLCTNRGFFRHKWVIAKWVMTLGMLYGGAAYLGPWSTFMLDMARDSGIAGLENADYLQAQTLAMRGKSIRPSLYVLSLLLFGCKPWEQEKMLAPHERF